MKWLNVASLWAAVSLCIRAVRNTNFDPKTSSIDWQVFVSSSSVSSCTFRYSTQIRPESLPSTSFPIHYSLPPLPLSPAGRQLETSWLNHTRTKTAADLKWTQELAQEPRHFYPCLSKICFMIILPTMFWSYSSTVSSRLPERNFPPCMLHFRPVVSFFI